MVRWHIFFRYIIARPMGAARNRRAPGPSSAKIFETTSSSEGMFPKRVALESADLSTLDIGRQAPLGKCRKRSSALGTGSPRMSRATDRTLRGETGKNRPTALETIAFMWAWGAS